MDEESVGGCSRCPTVATVGLGQRKLGVRSIRNWFWPMDTVDEKSSIRVQQTAYRFVIVDSLFGAATSKCCGVLL